MYHRFLGKKGKVVVAVGLNEESTPLLLAVQELAKATETPLRLTHVCELSQIYTLMNDYPGVIATNVELDEEVMQVARRNLDELARTLDPKINVQTHVCFGHAASNLMADAKSSGASMIVCTHKSSSYRFVPKGISTALSLMAESPVPVMVMNTQNPVSLNKEKLNILVADDLRDSSKGAISVACELAFAYPGSTITHFHVVPASKSEITNLKKNMGKKFCDDEVFALANLEKSIKERLDHRFGLISFLMEQNTTKLKQQIAFGEVGEELEKAVKESKADVVIVGRHEKIHRRPFTLGKFPYHAMLNLKCPLIVAPEALHRV